MHRTHAWAWLRRLGGLAAALLLVAAAPTGPTGAATTLYLPQVISHSNWQVLLEEGFENPWPVTGWAVSDPFNEYFWGRRICRAAGGIHSAWVAGGGPLGADLPCGANYIANTVARMKYGPFSLAGAAAAEFQLALWLDLSPSDQVCQFASPDNAGYVGYCYGGSSGGAFTPHLLDLSGYAGQSQVWVQVYFYSPNDVSRPEGAYVDDLVIRTCASGCGLSAAANAAPVPGLTQTPARLTAAGRLLLAPP